MPLESDNGQNMTKGKTVRQGNWRFGQNRSWEGKGGW